MSSSSSISCSMPWSLSFISLAARSSLPDMDELNAQIREVHLSYRQFTKELLRATPDDQSDKGADIDGSQSKSSRDSRPLYSLPKTDMPTFEGDPKQWRKFWERFNPRLSMHPDLPASEKIAQLEQAIKPPDGRDMISASKGTEEEYLACVKSLEQRYDQPKKIYRSYVHETYDHSTPHTRRGLYTLDSRLQDAMNGLALYGGVNAGSIMVAAAEKGLSKRTMSERMAYTAREKVTPTMDAFRQFIRQKAEELRGRSAEQGHDTLLALQHGEEDAQEHCISFEGDIRV